MSAEARHGPHGASFGADAAPCMLHILPTAPLRSAYCRLLIAVFNTVILVGGNTGWLLCWSAHRPAAAACRIVELLLLHVPPFTDPCVTCPPTCCTCR